jgi:hypothetical protein
MTWYYQRRCRKYPVNTQPKAKNTGEKQPYILTPQTSHTIPPYPLNQKTEPPIRGNSAFDARQTARKAPLKTVLLSYMSISPLMGFTLLFSCATKRL